MLYGIIEAPQNGWSNPTIVSAFAIGAALLGAFVLWERHTTHPMLDIEFFKNPRFSAASSSITLVFFAMFGSTFLLTQYFQFVLGYSPLETGVRLLPWAVTMMIGGPASARLVRSYGAKIIVTLGLLLVAIGLASMTALNETSSYLDIFWRLIIMGTGMSLVMAPATDSIMGSLPLGKAGVGSAVNDTTRQVGGALGVAIIGSVLSSTYGSKITDFLARSPVPTAAKDAAKNSLGGAMQVAQGAPTKQLGHTLTATAQSAFVDGLHHGVLVGAAVALVGAIVAFIWLPAHARSQDLEEQAAEYAGEASADAPAVDETAPLAPVRR